MGYRRWKKRVLSLPFKETSNLQKPLFGLADHRTGKALVRKNLAPRVKKHVSIHERVHLAHPKFGEVRTNIASFAIDPKGWVATAKVTLKDKERRKFYSKKFKRK